MNCINLDSSTPLRGRWLFDAGSDFSPFIFDITDPLTYPPGLSSASIFGLSRAIHEFRNPPLGYAGKCGSYREALVLDSDVDQLRRLFNIVKILRNHVAEFEKRTHLISMSNMCFPFVSSESLPLDLIAKRKVFVRFVKDIVFAGRDVDNMADMGKVSKTNLLIWVSIYLTHGSWCFFQKPMDLPAVTETAIAINHFNSGSSPVLTCARYCIMDLNRLKRILRRYHQSSGTRGHPLIP